MTVSVDPALYEWITARTGPGLRFSTLTHAVESGFVALRDDPKTK